MKCIILAGGFGTRLAEETGDKPKPMVKLGEQPIIWHIMNAVAQQFEAEFLIAAGYKANVIQNWLKELNTRLEIRVIDSGLNTLTGGRIKCCMSEYPQERMLATYGDGLANVDIRKLIDFHERTGKLATVTAVHPPARFGVIESRNGIVTHFGEKDQADAAWINGGYFVLEPEVIDLISSPETSFEFDVLPNLVSKGELAVYHHNGFWKPMDTLREKLELEKLAQLETPPWLAPYVE